MWQVVLFFLKQNRRVFFGFLLAGVIEIVASGAISSIFPETWYLRSFLRWEQKQKTVDFQKGYFPIIPDEYLGWRNQPNYSRGNVAFDEFGSRSLEKISQMKRKKIRVVFLGDSRIGGGEEVTNYQTINYYLEDENIEILNFGTRYFSLDQMYLLLMDVAKQFSPDVVLVGLGSRNTELLDCLFLPFANPEIEMALVKPRFVIQEKHLILIKPNISEFLEEIPNSIEPIAFFHRYDEHFQRFDRFKSQEFTPILGLINMLHNRLRDCVFKFKKEEDTTEPTPHLKSIELTNSIINAMEVYAHEWNSEIIFLLLPEEKEFEDISKENAFHELRKIVKLNGLNFLDGMEIFRENKGDGKIFTDGFHLTPEANQTLANKIKQMLEPGFIGKPGS